MARTHKPGRVVMVALIAGTLALGSLSVAFAGVGTSPSNAAREANHATMSGVAFKFTNISGESHDSGHADEIEILSLG